MNENVVRFESLGMSDVPRVGGKNASLGEMIRSLSSAGVNVPGGVGHFRVLQIIRESGGAAVAVAEKDILETLSQVYKEKGWSICPEGAACLAAIPQLVESGMIKPGNKVVVFNTGSLEKYLPDLRHLL